MIRLQPVKTSAFTLATSILAISKSKYYWHA